MTERTADSKTKILPGFEMVGDGVKTMLDLPKRGDTIQPLAQRILETGVRPSWMPRDIQVGYEPPQDTRVKD